MESASARSWVHSPFVYDSRITACGIVQIISSVEKYSVCPGWTTLTIDKDRRMLMLVALFDYMDIQKKPLISPTTAFIFVCGTAMHFLCCLIHNFAFESTEPKCKCLWRYKARVQNKATRWILGFFSVTHFIYLTFLHFLFILSWLLSLWTYPFVLCVLWWELISCSHSVSIVRSHITYWLQPVFLCHTELLILFQVSRGAGAYVLARCIPGVEGAQVMRWGLLAGLDSHSWLFAGRCRTGRGRLVDREHQKAKWKAVNN